MAEEFQGAVCGGNWWNPSINHFGSMTCSSAVNHIGGFFGWPSHDHPMIDMTRSSDDSAGSGSNGTSPIDVQKHQQLNGSLVSIDSTLQMMGIGVSSNDWDQDLLATSDENYSPILQQEAQLNSSMNYRQEIPKNFSCQESSSGISSFEQVNQSFLQQQTSLNSMDITSSVECSANSFPLNPASYDYSNSPLLQTLFEDESPIQRTMNYPNSDMGKPSFVKQVAHRPNFQFSDITPLWNGTAASLNDVRPTFIPSILQSQFINPSSINNIPKPINRPSFTAKHQNDKSRWEKKGCSSTEPAIKRQRIETPSPLPTFKVRKEKMGDRITALQQLVSPFGKTDTASVLHEAIEYIKFLHDQVTVLSTPYLKNGPPPLHHQNVYAMEAAEKIKDNEGLKHDLKSRGLCLVPISSTFPVATETTTDFWTPTFGGTFR